MSQALDDLTASIVALTSAVDAATSEIATVRASNNDAELADATAKVNAQVDRLNAAVAPVAAP